MTNKNKIMKRDWCYNLGSYDCWGTPVPIPNTEVKPTNADGSASRRCVRVGSCQDYDINFLIKERGCMNKEERV